MSRLKNWSSRKLEDFLKAYGFVHGYTNGSHLFYNGSIRGEQKVVQVIFSSRERECQTDKTMKMAIKNSGIPKNYFEEWHMNKNVHKDIIY